MQNSDTRAGGAKVWECPFCQKTKTKVESKVSDSIKRIGGIYMARHSGSVRCNCCHARGPTVHTWLALGQCGADKVLADQAIAAWNRRYTPNKEAQGDG